MMLSKMDTKLVSHEIKVHFEISRRTSGRKGRLNKRDKKFNRLDSFKDNTLAPEPYYEWLALNEAMREPSNYTVK